MCWNRSQEDKGKVPFLCLYILRESVNTYSVAGSAGAIQQMPVINERSVIDGREKAKRD